MEHSFRCSQRYAHGSIMLAGLERQGIDFVFGEASVRLRYDMAALLILEKRGLECSRIFSEDITDDELQLFFGAGLGKLKCRAEKLFSGIGRTEVLFLCRAAILLALPEEDKQRIPTPQSADAPPFDPHEQLFTLICDVMRKPEEFFWTSTLRELTARWVRYAVCKGYAKAPERVQMFDSEGME